MWYEDRKPKILHKLLSIIGTLIGYTKINPKIECA